MAEESEGTSKTDKFIATCRDRFKRCVEAESKNRERALEAIRFRDLDQWPEKIRKLREDDPEGARPCLTVDKLNQYVNQVKNDQRQNRPAVKVRPVDDKGDMEVAEVFQGIIRHIEDTSKADQAYDTGFEHAVDGGFGYWRILTDFTDEKSFEQDILIKRIRNRFSVYLDPDRQEPDGSDAKYGFVTEWIDREEFKATWPNKDPIDWETEGKDEKLKDWVTKEKVRIAEYFHYENVKKKLLLLSDGQVVLEDDLEKVQQQAQLAGIELTVIKERDTTIRQVKWSKVSGKEELEKKDWAGKWIPIVEVIGNEIDVEGERRLSGMIRAGMDAQRIHNYAASSFVENVALAPKAPFIAAEGQLEGHENDWKTANRRNIPVLQYKPIDLNGQPVPPPIRQPMPGISAGWQQVLQNTEHDIQASLGMYAASVGEPSNEKSGKAIMARQREGDTATFHYIDNLSRSIRHTGRILVDLIPKIYDTARVARILGEDGTPDMARLNPEQPQAVVKTAAGKIYNLHVGKYDVTVSVGPAYTTKRQEAAEWMSQMVQSKPELLNVIGDVMFRNFDLPGSDEIAGRLKKILPPELQEEDEEGNPNGQPNKQAMQMIQELQTALQEATQGQEAQKLGIEKFKAETDRIKVMGELELKQRDQRMDKIEETLQEVTAFLQGLRQEAA